MILSSHENNIKLLETTRSESGSGLNQANAIKNMLDEWDIQELCLGMCFDTTASNTGKMYLAGSYFGPSIAVDCLPSPCVESNSVKCSEVNIWPICWSES